MFNRKRIYIILLIVFTLLLCADVLAYALSSSTSSNIALPSNMQSGGSEGGLGGSDGTIIQNSDGSDGKSGFGKENSDTSASAMPETDGSGNSSGTASGDPSTMDGALSGQTDDGGNASGAGKSDIRQTDDSLTVTTDDSGNSSGVQGGNFDRQMQGDGSGRSAWSAVRSGFGFARFIGIWWIPIGVLCVLVDAFCVYMLIRLSKKAGLKIESAAEQSLEEEKAIKRKPELSSYEKRRRKRRRTIRIAVVILAVLAAIVLGSVIVRSIYLSQLAKEDSVKATSAEATSARIAAVISGTGTLSDEDAVEITVPNEVEIEAYRVKNGDSVKSGDVLAAVDHTSVMKAIEDLQEAMDALDQDIEAASGDSIETGIKACVDGRVKAIYARAGTAVADTMYDKGALMLISLDGLMAGDIETDADLATGDGVVVVLANGTKKAGRVDSVSEGGATITVTDSGTVYGENVTVTDENGNTLGTAPLYIHSELKVTGYSGTVSSIKCGENARVSSGDTLLTLTDTAYTAQYKLLLETRGKYEEEMIKLFKLYQDSNLYAEFAGTVSGLDEDTATEQTASTSAAASSDAASTNTAAKGATSSNATASVMAALNTAGSNLFAARTLAANVLASSTAYSFEWLGTDQPLPGENDSSPGASAGKNPSGASDSTVQSYSNYVAMVSSVSYSSIAIKEYATKVSITDYSDLSSLGVTTDMMTTETNISPSANTPVYMYENGVWTSLSLSEISAGDQIILTYDSDETTGDPVWIIIASKSGQSQGGSIPSYSGSIGSRSASTGTQTEDQQAEELYTVSDITAMSVTPSDTMSVTITIDEMDILSMKVGQEATITLDAINGQTFTGSVTKIDTTGTNSGGSTKFTAVVTFDRTEDMLAGMNAAVSITLSSMDCAVTIPVASLMESESGVFVYTSYDESKEQFGSPVNVTTGLSDGTNVEILSGIRSGDDVWYAYNDKVNIGSSMVSSSNGGGFNLMRMLRGR